MFSKLTGPRRLDPHQECKAQQPTISRYQECVLGFTTWCIEEGFDPLSPEEYDDLLVEWKNAKTIKKATFEGAVAAVELFAGSAAIAASTLSCCPN